MSTNKIIALFVFLELLIIAAGISLDGWSLTALQTITRFSGRLSLFLFSAIFLLHHKPDTIQAWLSKKFYLLFAIVHTIHLIEWVCFVSLTHAELIPLRVAGGSLAYAMIFVMPFLSHYRRLGRLSTGKFHLAQSLFMYYIWLIFFLTYLPRVQGKIPLVGGHYVEHVALLGWLSTLLGIKLAGLIPFGRPRQG